MFNYNKISNNIKAYSLNFSKKISFSLSLPVLKSIADLIFGIIKSNSSLLSNIARALNENIKLKDTIDRISKNLDKIYDNHNIVYSNYYDTIKNYITEDSCFHIDNSDVNKDSSSKLEDLDRVKDSSSKDEKIVNGYTITEIIATNTPTDLPISMYSKIFSSLSADYISNNNETLKAVDQISNYFGNIGTYIMDRGYDDKKYFKEFNNRGLKYIIRGKKNRTVLYKENKINIVDLAKQFKGKYNITLNIKGKTINRYCSYAKINISDVKQELYAVFVYFKNEVAIFYTNRELNVKNDVLNVIKNYYMRWRIEEYFKYKKQTFDFENYRVRTLKKMNALNLMITLAISCIYMITQNSIKLKEDVINISKAIKGEVYFEYYRITEGIYIALSHITKSTRHLIKKEKPSKYTQIAFFGVALIFAET